MIKRHFEGLLYEDFIRRIPPTHNKGLLFMLNTRTLVLSTVVFSASLSACSTFYPRLSSQFKGASQVPASPQKKAPQVKVMPRKVLKKTSKRKPATTNYLLHLNDADTARLYKKNTNAIVTEIVKGKTSVYKNGDYIDVPLKTLRSPVFRKAILATPRGKGLTSCQFIGLQIELDGKKQTSDWIVTTKGKGKCNSRSNGDPRYFWIIQQDKVAPADILLAGRASSVMLTGQSKKPHYQDIFVSNSGYIKIKDGDKLADGSWVQVNSSDKGRVFISCKNKFHLEGKRYKSDKGTVEASVNSAMMSGKFWQPVSDPRYRCFF